MCDPELFGGICVDINQLKQEARELERQGRYREALAMYRHALTSLEGSPQLLRELPLYVKAGDLYLKLDKVKAGVSLYEQVGKIYAAHGSAKSVGAVCVKVVRAMPERAHVFPRMVRLMLERGHVAPARAVLELWAEHARLRTTHDLLQTLDEVSDEDMLTVLEAIVEMAERLEASPETSSAAVATAAEAEPRPAEPAAPEPPPAAAAAPPSPPEAPSPEPPVIPEPPAEPEVETEPPEAPVEQVPEAADETVAAAPPSEEPPAEPAEDARLDAEPPAAEPEEDAGAPAASEEPPVEEEPTAEPEEEDVPVGTAQESVAEEEPAASYEQPDAEEPETPEVIEEEPVVDSAPRPSVRRSSFGSVLVQEPKQKSGPSGRTVLIGVSAAVIVIALVAVPIVWLGLVPLGGGDGQSNGGNGTARTPEVVVPGQAAADTGADTLLPTTLDPNPAFAAEPVTQDTSDTIGTPIPGDTVSPSAAVETSRPPEEPPVVPPPDTAAAQVTPPAAPADTSLGMVTSVTTVGEEITEGVVVAIQGLAIEDLRAATRNGTQGQELGQVTEAGNRVTVFSYRSAGGSDTPAVSLESDTTLGRQRVGGFLVEIRGTVDATTMWQLIDRLATRNAPTN